MDILNEIIAKYLINEGANEYIIKLEKKKFKNIAAVTKEWKRVQAHDMDMYGHDPYNGTSATFGTGLDVRNISFKSFRDVSDFILDNHDKWDPAIAVEYKDGRKEMWAVGGWAAE